MAFEAAGGTGKAFVPIKDLSLYGSKWTIRARVMTKSDCRVFHNQRGEGKLFSCQLLDDSGEIRVTFFGDAVAKYYDMLHLNKVYSFSNGLLKLTNKKFNPKGDYEITFDERACIAPLENTPSFAEIRHNFVKLQEIRDVPVGETVDVAAIVKHVEDVETIFTKLTGEQRSKRNLILWDDTDTTVRFILWGDRATKTFDTNGVIFVKGARVGEFQGKTLNVTAATHIEVNSAHERARELVAWSNGSGASLGNPEALSLASEQFSEASARTLEAILIEADALAVQSGLLLRWCSPVTICKIPYERPPFYRACQEEVSGRKCLRKVDLVDGCYRCSDGHIAPNTSLGNRFVLNINIADHSANKYATAFNEVGQKIMQRTADEVAEEYENDKERYEDVIEKLQFTKWTMQLKCVKERYNDKDRIKMTILDAIPLTNVSGSSASASSSQVN